MSGGCRCAARDLYRLHQLFAGTAAEGLASWALLQRLLAEQACRWR